jgi:hypothetical protein
MLWTSMKRRAGQPRCRCAGRCRLGDEVAGWIVLGARGDRQGPAFFLAKGSERRGKGPENLDPSAGWLFGLSLGGGSFLNGGLGGGQTGYRDAERRAANVGQAQAVAEFYAFWVSAVFATDAQLYVGTGLATFGYGDFHELAHAGLVDGGERVLFDDFQFLVGAEEGAGIVAAHAESSLGQVIGAKAEEFGGVGNFVGREGAARNFNHGADEIVEFYVLFFHDIFGDAMNDFNLKI